MSANKVSSPSKNTCCVCYEEISTEMPCCKQGICQNCAKSWIQKSQNASCPMCREQLYTSLNNIPKDEDVVVFHTRSSLPDIGKIKLCKKVLKINHASGKCVHMPYEHINSYRIYRAPEALACGPIQSEWIQWCANSFKGPEPQCSQLCIQPRTLACATNDYNPIALQQYILEHFQPIAFESYGQEEEPTQPVLVYNITARWLIESM